MGGEEVCYKKLTKRSLSLSISPEAGARQEGQEVCERADAERAAACEDLGVTLNRHLEQPEQRSHLPLVNCGFIKK